MKKKIVIVGGGAAGWLSALYIKNLLRADVDVTLVESEDIGILGAGEGSVPYLINFLQKLDINIHEFIAHSKGTNKIGVSFENWNANGKKYIHDFFSTDLAFPSSDEYFVGYMLKQGKNLNDEVASKVLAYSDKSPLNDLHMPTVAFSAHFDAKLAADFFKGKALSRGIKRIEGVVTDFNIDNNGNVKGVNLQSGETISKIDFVFDCSGFARLLIGKQFNSEWVSYKDRLKVNSALTFQLPTQENKISPYTKAIAMKCGWMWQIPLQERIGCGYVFDSTLIDTDAAKDEVRQFIGSDVKFNKVIPFEPGVYKSLWINNCIAIGLSTGFVEPLEATSLLMACYSLDLLNKKHFDRLDQKLIKQYNENIFEVNSDICDFLQFHYFTNKNEGPFWNAEYLRNNQSNDLATNVEMLSKDFQTKPKPKSIFSKHSWRLIGCGNEFLDEKRFIEMYEERADKELISEYYEWYSDKVKKTIKNSITEFDYRKLINKKYKL